MKQLRMGAGVVASGAGLVAAGVVFGALITGNLGWLPSSSADEGLEATYSRQAALANGESPFVAVAEAVLPAVVSVDTKRVVKMSQDPFRDMLREFFGERMFRDQFGEPQSQEYEIPGSASGFVLDGEGYVLTNNHVVQGADEIEVTLSDGRAFDAEIVGRDPSTDIAVLRIQGEDLPTLVLGDSDELRVGDWAIAIGNPLELKGTVTVGVVSALGRADLQIRGGAPVYQDFIQTDASITFGNSGGPLVNIRGEVVGINTAVNASVSGIGFAIPINIAREVAESLMGSGKVVRGYLGVVPQEITPALAEAKNLGDAKGILIAAVEASTPAGKAGLESGDVVIEFAGVSITGVNQFRKVVAAERPGEKVDIVVIRDGKQKALTATLEERPDVTAESPTRAPEAAQEWLGLEVAAVDGPEARRAQIQAESGVLIVSVEPRSPADDAGLEAGDVVLEIGDREIAGLGDYESAMREFEDSKRPIAFLIQRGSAKYFVALEPRDQE